MKINLGSGYRKIEDFINVDSDINCNPDFVVDLDDKNLVLPFESNSVEVVVAHHILEHIGDGYIKLLQEIYRICKNEAIIDIRVPHHFHETFINDPTHKRPITVEGLKLFSKKHNLDEIERAKQGQTHSSTLGLVYDVDFEIVHYDYVYDGFYNEIMKTNSMEQNQRLFREALNTTLETYVVLKVVK